MEENILFVWPPLIRPRWLPLGIPFLVSHLRSRGVNHIEVFDMNMAYLKQIQPFWSRYLMMKRGAGACKRRILAKGKQENILDPLVWGFYNYVHRKKNELVNSLGPQVSFIPWSLNAILASVTDDQFGEVRKKVGGLLAPMMAREPVPLVCFSACYPEQLFFALSEAQEL